MIRSLCLILFISPVLWAADPPDLPLASKQIPDVATLPDRTEDFRKQIADTGGTLLVPPGVHRITGTLEFVLAGKNSATIRAEKGSATIVMDGPGPAIRIAGSHKGSAAPSSFQPNSFHEATPLIEDLEILGNHPEADGIELARTFQPVISRVAVRWCRHAIHLIESNRNLTITDVHLYENSGAGIFYDHVNLHQSNIINSHISYNREGGIVVRNGQICNMQVTGCDIEGNMPDGDTPTQAANILFDISESEDSRSTLMAEVTITACTLQHKSRDSGQLNRAEKELPVIAPGGANIRILGKKSYPIDSVSITGNLLSDCSINTELRDCNEVLFSGNILFAPHPDNLLITRGKRITVTGNAFNPREYSRPGRIVLDSCSDLIFGSNTLRGLLAPAGAVVVRDSERIHLADNILTESTGGLSLQNSRDILVSGWTVSGFPTDTPWITSDARTERLTERSNTVVVP